MNGCVFARSEHGGHPVFSQGGRHTVHWPDGPRTYPSARQTIIALVNGSPNPDKDCYNPNWTYDRYFRQGKYRRDPNPEVDVFDLFSPKNNIQVTVKAMPQPKLGIDLENRWNEVRKLFFAGFGRRVYRMGYDPEDVLQEVYKALLVRNLGKCPWDPRKSSFGHYVHMVCGCIISNYRRKYSRLEHYEVFEARTISGTFEDVAYVPIEDERAITDESPRMESFRQELGRAVRKQAGPLADLAESCIDYLSDGMKNREIVDLTGEDPGSVAKAVRLVKHTARGLSDAR